MLIITDAAAGTIEFKHSRPPRGAHKTYAPWLDRKLEKQTPLQISSSAYNEIACALIEAGTRYLYERRSDNSLVMVIGDRVFSDSEYRRRRAERLAAERGGA